MSTKTSLTLASALAMAGVTGSALAVPDQKEPWDKCAAIAKAGQNDCGALGGAHACAGQTTASSAPQEWVRVPAGTCAK